ncbi:unnamed protein product [Phaedon cochleariae]|uniref:CCHC-type domain-containing protein n=1 Tax=Phaedon cochleariae TaxID=80249 RepID=A0A9N9SPM5_PHACE|nr:unnamed protein product [Phaedon cochleariae]
MEKNVKVGRCSKFWSHAHKREQCDGPDRTNGCYRCGESDHRAKECQNQEFCPICMEKGHKTGTARCPAFEEALKKARSGARWRNASMGALADKDAPTTTETNGKVLGRQSTLSASQGENNSRDSKQAHRFAQPSGYIIPDYCGLQDQEVEKSPTIEIATGQNLPEDKKDTTDEENPTCSEEIPTEEEEEPVGGGIFQGNVNTKLEIKKISKEICTTVKTMKERSRKLWELEEEERNESREQTTKAPIADIKGDKDMGIQVDTDLEEIEEIRRETEASEDIRRNLKEANTIEEVQTVIWQDWPAQTYKNTNITTESPLGERKTDLILCTNKENDEEKSINKAFQDRYPELNDEEGEATRTYKLAENSVRLPETGQTMERSIFKINTTAIDQNSEISLDLMKAIQSPENDMTNNERTKATMMITESIDQDGVRKLLEYTLQNTNIEIDIYIPNNNKARPNTKDRQVSTRSTKKKPSMKKEAIIIAS